MNAFQKWWQRRRLLARLREVDKQLDTLSEERFHLLDKLHYSSLELWSYRLELDARSARISYLRDKLNKLSHEVFVVSEQIRYRNELVFQLIRDLNAVGR